MLARDLDPGMGAVVAEDVLVMLPDHFVLGFKRRVRKAFTGFEVMDHLSREPRPAIGAAPDQHAVGTGLVQTPLGVVQGEDIAICEYGNIDRFLDASDELPIR